MSACKNLTTIYKITLTQIIAVSLLLGATTFTDQAFAGGKRFSLTQPSTWFSKRQNRRDSVRQVQQQQLTAPSQSTAFSIFYPSTWFSEKKQQNNVSINSDETDGEKQVINLTGIKFEPGPNDLPTRLQRRNSKESTRTEAPDYSVIYMFPLM